MLEGTLAEFLDLTVQFDYSAKCFLTLRNCHYRVSTPRLQGIRSHRRQQREKLLSDHLLILHWKRFALEKAIPNQKLDTFADLALSLKLLQTVSKYR